MREFAKFQLDKGVLYVTYQSFDPTPSEFNEYLNTLEKYLRELDSYIVIYDASLTKFLSAEMRALQAKWINENKDMIGKKIKKMIFIIPSIPIRLILKTILSFSPLPSPHEVVVSKSAAEVIARSMN